jgi:hypothetical protein
VGIPEPISEGKLIEEINKNKQIEDIHKLLINFIKNSNVSVKYKIDDKD